MPRKPSPCRMECREHCAQQRPWVRGSPVVLDGTRSRRSFSEQGRRLVQETRRVRSGGENRETIYEVGEERAAGFCGLRYIHQGRKTTELTFQIIISLRIKRSTSNNCTGNPGVETVPGKPKQVTMFKTQFKLHLLPPGSIP